MNEDPILTAEWTKVDAIGLAADATGTFHTFWLDDRTGALQIWTAAVKLGSK